MSRLDVIVGPNGAGKTTLFERVLAPLRLGLAFVNADRIAAERFFGREVEEAYEAARIGEATRQALIEARLDFRTETVFSHDSKVDLVTSAASATDDGPNEVASYRYGLADHQPRWPTWTPEPLQAL